MASDSQGNAHFPCSGDRIDFKVLELPRVGEGMQDPAAPPRYRRDVIGYTGGVKEGP